MKIRITSFLLMLVMVVLAVPAFVLPSYATSAELPFDYSTKWVDNTPKVDTEAGTVAYPSTAWSIGYKSDVNTFVLFGKYASAGGADAKLIAANNDMWANGGYYSSNYSWKYYRVGLAANPYLAYRYVAEYTGTAVLSVTELNMLACDNNHAATGVTNSAFAIAVNGEVKWPVGATYADSSTWFYNADKAGDIAADIDDVTVFLNEGDAVEFLFARRTDYAWSHHEFDPVVTYTTKMYEAPALPYTTKWIDAYPVVADGTVTYPTDAWAVGYSAIGKNDFHAFDQVQSDYIRSYGMYEWTYGGMFYNNKNVGGTWYYGGVLIAGAKNQYASSYRYVAEYTGTATISADNLVFIDAELKNGKANAAMTVMVNGDPIWPAGAKANDVSTWYYAGENINVNLAAELGEITLKLNKGDWVEFKFATVNSGWATSDFKPVVTYTDINMNSCNVTYIDENNTLLANYAVAPGTALPICPINATWDVDGDGVADTLPETGGNITIKLLTRATQTSTSINPTVVNNTVVASTNDGWDVVFLNSAYGSFPSKETPRYVPDSISTTGGFTWVYSYAMKGGAPSDPQSTAGFVTTQSGSWYPNGSIIAESKFTAGWRYTATYSGVADVTVDLLKNCGQWASAATPTSFTILKNGEKIWPTDSNWYTFNTKDQNMAETIMASAADVLTGITLKKGDVLEFLVTDNGGTWSNQCAGQFTVSYREAPASATLQSGAVALGEKFAPVYTVDSTTVPAGATNVGLYANGVFYPAAEGKVALPGVAAKNLTDDIDVTVAYTVDGTEAYGKTYTYSVADLLMSYVKDDTTDKASNLAIATLNYAAAAQTFFGYNTENLANSKLTDAQKAVGAVAATDSHSILTKPGTAPIADVYGVKLMLNDTVDVAIYFTSELDLTEGYEALCIRHADPSDDSDSGSKATATEIVKVGEGLYKVIFRGFMPTSWNGDYEFSLVTAGTSTPVSEILSYNVLDYIARAQNGEAAEITAAMYALYSAAVAYNA